MENATKKFFDNLAPDWGKNERHTQEEIFDFLYANVPLKAGMRVLDVGCGVGIISEPANRMTKQKVLSIDISSAMIEIAEKSRKNPDIEFRECDFYDLKEHGFDALICFNAYPHFINAAEFAKKACEVLVSGGLCAIMHNMSRKALSEHHKAVAQKVSRELKPAEIEASVFTDKFSLLNLVDNDEMFLMLFKKK